MPAKRAFRCPTATSAATAVTSAAPSRGGAALGIAFTVDRCLQTGAAKGSAPYTWTWHIINKAQLTSFTEGGFVSRSVKQTVPARVLAHCLQANDVGFWQQHEPFVVLLLRVAQQHPLHFLSVTAAFELEGKLAIVLDMEHPAGKTRPGPRT